MKTTMWFAGLANMLVGNTLVAVGCFTVAFAITFGEMVEDKR